MEQTLDELVTQIAQRLQETNYNAIRQITSILTHCGTEQTLSWFEEALTIEANGGLMIGDESRRRTPGGVFLYLARTRVSDELRAEIFPRKKWVKDKKKKFKKRPPVPRWEKPPIPPFEPGELRTLVESSLQMRGEVESVRVILTGRPGQIEKRPSLIVTSMVHEGKFPPFPRGLPAPVTVPTTYVVYISENMWLNVEEALTNPEDQLVVEGQCALDPELGQVVIYTTSLTTKFMHQAKREADKQAAAAQALNAEAQSAPPAKSAPKGEAKTAPKAEANLVPKGEAKSAPPANGAPKAEAKTAPPAKSAPKAEAKPAPLPKTSPPHKTAPKPKDAVREERLAALQQAEQEAEDKLETIKALPPAQQQGLFSAMRDLQKIRDEIRMLML
jgi:hypothetical protein